MKKHFLEGGPLLFFIIFAVSIFPAVSLAMESTTYEIKSDVIGSFGDTGNSTTYSLQDTGGEVGTGSSISASFGLEPAGFWQTDGLPISIDCDASVSMGTIVGTGSSNLATNSAECLIVTDNPNGYLLTWEASPADMQSNADTIVAYTPAAASTPESWSVEASASEWGAHVGSASTTVDTGEWGTADTYSGGKWLNISPTPRTIVERSDQTSSGGDSEIIWFGAEIGSNKFQPTGNYSVNVTFTAVSL